jgi:hypothetical protein
MGDGDKMKDLSKTKSLFLPRELPDDEGHVDIYYLEKEFARSRRNRNVGLWLTVLGFISILVAGTLTVSLYIEKSKMKGDFIITEYQDLNLRDLLDSSRKNQKQLDLARKTLEELRAKRQKELEQATTEASRRAIAQKYDKLMADEERKIADLQKSINQFDLTMRENIRKAEEMVNNYRRLQEMELQKTRDELILKYNPIFQSPQLNAILDERVGKRNAAALKPFSALVAGENIMTRDEFETLRRRVGNQRLLMDRMNEIPYTNSVKPALATMSSIFNSAVFDYERLWSGPAARLEERNRTLDSYAYALDSLIKTRPESGYIIDAGTKNNILVYMNRIYNVSEGTADTSSALTICISERSVSSGATDQCAPALRSSLRAETSFPLTGFC